MFRDQTFQPHQAAWRNRSGPISPCSNGARWMPSKRHASGWDRLALRMLKESLRSRRPHTSQTPLSAALRARRRGV